MKKILKSRLFIFILGGIFFSSITALAVTKISADKITYTDKNNIERTVDVVLDDLYDKANSKIVATQVATLTTQGASYTMQNDGYIVGTAKSNDGYSACVYFDDDEFVVARDGQSEQKVSIYITKGTTFLTRETHGTYNLTVYEWK